MNFRTKNDSFVMISERVSPPLMVDPDLRKLIYEAIEKHLNLPDQVGRNYSYKQSMDFGRIIGGCACVPVDSESGWFASRRGKRTALPVVFDREKLETSFLTLTLVKHRFEDLWVVVDFYIGSATPCAPYDRLLQLGSSEYQQSLDFWTSHALVYDPETMAEPYESSWEQELEKLKS